MLILFIPMTWLVAYSELQPNPTLQELALDTKAGSMEGKETRIGAGPSAMFASVSAATAGGSVNAMHDSFMPLSGVSLMLFMQLGEVVFGGAGAGLYGLLMFTLLTVFVGGLMVGRTPEFLCKKLGAFDVKMASLVMLVPTTLVLLCTAVAVAVEAGRAGVFNPGAQGFSEILYAVSSAANNNGSTYGGLSANTPFYNIFLGVVMLLGRYGVMLPVLAAAGSLAAKNTVPVSVGTMPTHTPMFIGLLIGVIVLIGALNYVPALALGPVVEHIHLMQKALPQ
ncbi:MAG: potassium-transporting ATPase subunit KdpA, partial [Rickettsiales bacterium]|nr:potassium-transporting ATPase subunit KdpA [Rickettsiales bacterium]